MKKKIQRCPKCKSANTLMYYAAALTGAYRCKKCGYLGPIVLEEDVEIWKVYKSKKNNIRVWKAKLNREEFIILIK